VLGQRTWGFNMNNQSGSVIGPGHHAGSSSGLATFKLKVFAPATNGGRAAVAASPAGTPANTFWLGFAQAPVTANQWSTVDGAALTYSWTLVNAQPDQTGAFTPAGQTSPNATIAGFVSAKGDGPMDAWIGFGCDGQDWFFDDFEYGAAGNVTTYDFEAALFNGTLSPTPSTITAGQVAKLTFQVVDTTVHKGRPLVVQGLSNPRKPGVVVTLWRKTSIGSVKLATSKVRSTGTYKIFYIANHTGSWTLYTTIAAASGNLAGRSVNRTAKVVL
jgi:hypothetical protein